MSGGGVKGRKANCVVPTMTRIKVVSTDKEWQITQLSTLRQARLAPSPDIRGGLDAGLKVFQRAQTKNIEKNIGNAALLTACADKSLKDDASGKYWHTRILLRRPQFTT